MAKKVIPWTKIKAEYLNGVTPKQLAEKYPVTEKQIYNKAYNDGWTDEIKKIQENVRETIEERITSLTNLALDTLENVMNGFESEDNTKVSAAKAILDISGLKSSKVEQTNINKNPIPIEIIE